MEYEHEWTSQHGEDELEEDKLLESGEIYKEFQGFEEDMILLDFLM